MKRAGWKGPFDMVRLILQAVTVAALAAWPGLAPAAAAEDECLDGQVLEIGGCVDLDTAMAGDLQISNAWVGATEAGAKVAAAYLTILNRGDATDRLKGATTLTAAKVELHEMRRDDGKLSMRPVAGGLAIDPGDTVEMKPGGLHLMLTGIGEGLEAEDEIELTLDFEKAGRVVLVLPVRHQTTVKAHRL